MPQKKMEESETVQSLVPDQPEAAADSEVPTDVPEENLPPVEDTSSEPSSSAAEEDAPKPKAKRSTRKKAKKAEPEAPPEAAGGEIDETAPPEVIPETSAEDLPKPAVRRRRPERPAPILTLEAGGDVETEESAADTAWHEIHNAYRTRRILTGMLGGIEQLDNGKTIAIVEYKGFRVVIPLKEMVMRFPNQASGDEYREQVVRHHKLLSNMLGAEIDFVVKGIDSKTRSIVASRKEAMLKKRQTFYMDTDASGTYRIYDGRIVQARVIAVAEKAVRIEAFGVECSIMARDLSWDWIGDAHDRFSVGDQVLVRIISKTYPSRQTLRAFRKTPTGTISKNAAFRANMRERSRMYTKGWFMSALPMESTPWLTPAMTGACREKRMMSVLLSPTLMKNAALRWESSPVSSSRICNSVRC